MPGASYAVWPALSQFSSGRTRRQTSSWQPPQAGHAAHLMQHCSNSLCGSALFHSFLAACAGSLPASSHPKLALLSTMLRDSAPSQTGPDCMLPAACSQDRSAYPALWLSPVSVVIWLKCAGNLCQQRPQAGPVPGSHHAPRVVPGVQPPPGRSAGVPHCPSVILAAALTAWAAPPGMYFWTFCGIA